MTQLKPTEYRCSCCDNVKDVTNSISVIWDDRYHNDKTPWVDICKSCNTSINKTAVKGVYQYLQLER